MHAEQIMKYKGYTGRLLQVNLTTREITFGSLSEKLVEEYIGGVGIAAALISEKIPQAIDPCAEESPLILYGRTAYRHHHSLERQALCGRHISPYRPLG